MGYSAEFKVQLDIGQKYFNIYKKLLWHGLARLNNFGYSIQLYPIVPHRLVSH